MKEYDKLIEGLAEIIEFSEYWLYNLDFGSTNYRYINKISANAILEYLEIYGEEK